MIQEREHSDRSSASKGKSRWNPEHQWRGQPQRGPDAASTVTGRKAGMWGAQKHTGQ